MNKKIEEIKKKFNKIEKEINKEPLKFIPIIPKEDVKDPDIQNVEKVEEINVPEFEVKEGPVRIQSSRGEEGQIIINQIQDFVIMMRGKRLMTADQQRHMNNLYNSFYKTEEKLQIGCDLCVVRMFKRLKDMIDANTK